MVNKQAKFGRGFDPNHLTARNVAVLVPVILGLSALFVTFAFLVSDDTYIRWGGLAVDTAILFGFLLYNSRKALKHHKLWVLFCAFLVLHAVLWIAILRIASEWRLAWFGLMAFEAPAFLLLRNFALLQRE